MKCRCGHGRQWHKRPLRVSGWQRQRQEKPKGSLPCQFMVEFISGKRCPCRNWVEVSNVR